MSYLSARLNSLACKCQHPVRVFNKYTQEFVLTNCNKCYACILRKKSANTSACQNEADKAVYTIFGTLTYSDKFIPRMSFAPSFDDMDDSFVSVDFSTVDRNLTVKGSRGRSRVIHDEIHSFTHLFAKDDYIAWHEKVKLIDNQFVPVSNYRDIQLFNKRLRKYFSDKKYGYKIRIYTVSEYGPQTYRPHWHFLLYLTPVPGFEEIKELPPVAEAVSACWQYGRTDTSLSRGGAASYTAGYVNSAVCLPLLYERMPRPYRPRAGHSMRFGAHSSTDLAVAAESIAEGDYSPFVDGVCISRNGYSCRARYPRTSLSIFFNPLARHFSVDSQSYQRLLATTQQVVGGLFRLGSLPLKETYTPMDVARAWYVTPRSQLSAVFGDGQLLVDHLACMESLRIGTDEQLTMCYYRVFLSLFKTLRFYSYNFPQYDSYSLCEFIARRTYSYFDYRDKTLLCEQLAIQEEEPSMVNYYMQYYHTTPNPSFDECKDVYDVIVDSSYQKVLESIKHKEYNDLSNLLNH